MYIFTYKMYLLWVAIKRLALIFHPELPSLHKISRYHTITTKALPFKHPHSRAWVSARIVYGYLCVCVKRTCM